MRLAGDWIEVAETQAVLRVLMAGKYQAKFVGGCVRNSILGAPVGDIDIATDARPEQVTALAQAAGMKAIPTGIDHGTVTVVANHTPHEVTTFRKDVETFGRHAVVAFSTDLAEDARRRDFTMNALYADADGVVIDPLDGLGDLLARRVRFIEDPGSRICEDYLRILRFFRFHAWYGDAAEGLDAEGLAAVAQHVEGLADLSRERVGSEILKLLSAADPAPSVAAMRSSGVLNRVLPGADDRYLAPLVHLEGGEVSPDAIRRLVCLGGDASADRLRLSRKQLRQLDELKAQIGEATGARELGYRQGNSSGLDILLLRAAMLEQPLSDNVLADLAIGARAEFPVSAQDLMPELSGAALGAQLKKLEARWIASGFTLQRDDLL